METSPNYGKSTLRTPPSTSRGSPSSSSAPTWLSPPNSTSASALDPCDHVSQLERRSALMKQMGELQLNLHLVVDVLRGARTIDRCVHLFKQKPEDVDPAFFVGRIMDSCKKLLEIATRFRFVSDVPTAPEQNAMTRDNLRDRNNHDHKLEPDVITILSLATSYTMVTRLFRVTFWALHDSLPFIRSPHFDIPVNLGGLFHDLTLRQHDLRGRWTKQILFLIDAAEDLIGRVEIALGIPGRTVGRADRHQTVIGDAQRMILSMLDQEAQEQPALDEPRGECGNFREVLQSLKQALEVST